MTGIKVETAKFPNSKTAQDIHAGILLKSIDPLQAYVTAEQALAYADGIGKAAEAEVARLTARLAEAEKVIAPFADIARYHEAAGSGRPYATVRVDDVRAARAFQERKS